MIPKRKWKMGPGAQRMYDLMREGRLNEDRVTEGPPEELGHGKIFSCIERACVGHPLHAHSHRAYLVYAKDRL